MSALYLGPPGVGKSLSLVRYVALAAIMRGQRVLTNIPLVELAFAQRLKSDVSGLIRLVTSQEIQAPNFWFCAEGVGETISKGGDCIIIDEAHEFYGSDKKIKSDDEVFRAIRFQRKYTGGPGNWSTSISFASQVYEDFSPQIRNVCDSMYFMQKLTVVGAPDSYRVDIYSDARKTPSRGKPVNQLFGKYDDEYYCLYNSYATGVGGFSSTAPGTETINDDRLNIWNRRFGWGPISINMRQAKYLGIAFVVAVFSVAGYTLYRSVTKTKATIVKAPLSSAAPADHAGLPSTTPRAAGTSPASPPVIDDFRKDEASDYRLIGFYTFNALTVAVIADRSGVYRYLSSDFEIVSAGPASHIKYKGKVIAAWTGSAVSIPTKNAFTEIVK